MTSFGSLAQISRVGRLELAIGVAWAIVIGALVLMAAVSFTNPGWDQSAFAYVGKGILEGEVPYADRWDNKGPVTYLIYAVGHLLPGWWGMWLINMAFLLGSAWLAYRIVQREFGTTAALFSVATLLIYARTLGNGGGLTEQYALLFQLLALNIFLSSVRQGGSGPRLCIALGVLGALSLLLRENLVGVWVTIGIYWVGRWRESGSSIVWSTVGGLLVLIVTSLTFAYLGAWEEFWDATVLFNFAHSAASFDDRIRAAMLMVWYLSPVVPLFGIGWCVGIWYHFTSKSQGETFERVLPFLLILGPVEVALSLVSGNGWSHYNIPLLPVGIMYLGFLVWLVTKEHLAAPALVAFLLLFATVNYHMGIYTKAFEIVRMVRNTSEVRALTARERDLRVAEAVVHNSGDDDTILVWGTHPQIYLMAGRDSPTRFFYQYPLIKEGYSRESDLADFFSDVISTTPPAVIIDTRNRNLPPLDEASRKEWQPQRQYVHDPTRFQKFFDYLHTEYELREVVGGHWVYVTRK